MVGSTEYALIWREKATPAGASISRLAPWTPPISDSGSIGSQPSTWPTPDASLGGADPETRKTGLSVQTFMVRAAWPTPTSLSFDTSHQPGNNRSSNKTLDLAYGPKGSPWATPRASDGEKGGPNMAFGAGGTPLPAQMHQASPWPTPQARDGMPPHSAEYVAKHKANGHGMANLNDHMAFSASGAATPGSSATTERPAGSPNPAFPCWLQGYPVAWLLATPSAKPGKTSRKRSKTT